MKTISDFIIEKKESCLSGNLADSIANICQNNDVMAIFNHDYTIFNLEAWADDAKNAKKTFDEIKNLDDVKKLEWYWCHGTRGNNDAKGIWFMMAKENVLKNALAKYKDWHGYEIEGKIEKI